MGKTVDKPKKYIVSCRISRQEMEQLQRVARQSGTNISSLLRETLNCLAEPGVTGE
ncbi:MAG: hydrogen-dependent growth transcriptional repressor [Syntrophotaleaceae bacterium]